ncbi:hypothetical protein [Streptomyces sp. NBC_00690]|uniref:hypothetical protein n=1 Tax=Streptomyces sp. NBC_00690 TaxID=2975808 RepID=UPI002E29E9A9|nr:hypothetical protein [Streptomyces sp. NBC_00690]
MNATSGRCDGVGAQFAAPEPSRLHDSPAGCDLLRVLDPEQTVVQPTDGRTD